MSEKPGTTTDFKDALGPQNDEYYNELLACTNQESSRFCDFYGVNIYTFIDLAFYE